MKSFFQGVMLTGLLSQAAIANDGAAPAVEVEVPQVEVPMPDAPAPEVEIQILSAETTVDPSEIQTLAMPECDHTDHLAEDCTKEILNDFSTTGGPDIVTFGGVTDDSILQSRGGDEIAPNQRNLEMMSATGGVAVDQTSRGSLQLADEQRGQVRFFHDGAEKSKQPGFFAKLMGKKAPRAMPVSQTDRTYAKELAEIDGMRDKAVRTGDRALLAQADQKEAKLKAARTKSSVSFFRK
jgi:hypothetical protein